MNMIRLAFVFGIFLAYKLRKQKTILKLLLILGLLFQISLMYWYKGADNIFLTEGLPLYHCRIATIMMAISYFSNRQKQARYFAWLGILGAFIAFMIPDPSKYLWPHITNLTYIGSHLTLVMTGTMILLNSSVRIDYRDIFKYTIIVNSLIFIANFIFSSNYGYLSKLPQALNIDLPKPLIFMAITGLITVCLGFFETDLWRVNRRILAKEPLN
ncbi:MAG: TIGR02206 family membrane protein [Peptoniphilaceae bacterium]|nr:TIGR02206 family membrane protein [Peptoniphilaceae bacterium]MDY6019516.1 TIGR02206 family membrane protein [Anaerococcus sp.]